jgi:hypothetical protein
MLARPHLSKNWVWWCVPVFQLHRQHRYRTIVQAKSLRLG